MNSIPLVLFSSFFLLLSLPSAFANESDELCTENCPNFNGTENSPDIERPKFYKIIDPDIHIDFSNDNHWQGLSSTSDFWKIKNNEGYFILNPQIKQLNSANKSSNDKQTLSSNKINELTQKLNQLNTDFSSTKNP